MKKLVALLLAVGMALSLVGCGNNAATETTEPTGTTETKTDEASAQTSETASEADTQAAPAVNEITICVPVALETLQPQNMNDTARSYILPSIYQCLYWFDGQNYIGQLVKETTVVDETHWDLTLYDYITDSDGNNIKASDVVFSYNWLLENNLQQQFKLFESIEAIDEYTVEFTFTAAPKGITDLEFIMARVGIFSEKAYNEHSLASDPIGTGPYVVTAFTSGSSVTLEAREDYWQTEELTLERDVANIQKINFEFITEDQQRTMALETKSVDFVSNVDEYSVAAFDANGQYDGDYDVIYTTSEQIYYLIPNCSGGIVADENFRKAMWYGLTNDVFAAVISGADPAMTIGNDYYIDYNTAWETETSYLNTYDVEAAKQYLAESGYNGETLIVACDTSENAKNLAQVFQAQMGQIGINFEILAQDNDLLRTLTQSTEGWNVRIGWSASGSILSGAIGGFTKQDDKRGGYAPQMIIDDDLQAAYMFALSVEGHSEESVHALINYVLDNAYVYTPIRITSPTVYSVKFSELYYDAGTHTLVAGACKYN